MAPSPPLQALSPDFGRPRGFRTFRQEAERPPKTASIPRPPHRFFAWPQVRLLGRPESQVKTYAPRKAAGRLTSLLPALPGPRRSRRCLNGCTCRTPLQQQMALGDERHQPISAQKASVVPPPSPAARTLLAPSRSRRGTHRSFRRVARWACEYKAGRGPLVYLGSWAGSSIWRGSRFSLCKRCKPAMTASIFLTPNIKGKRGNAFHLTPVAFSALFPTAAPAVSPSGCF